jgi:hypothetical protein
MTQPGNLPDDGADIRTALGTLVAHEPELPSGSADIERRGRRRVTTRRLGGTVATAVVLVAAGVGAFSLAGRGPAEPTPIAQPPETTTPADTSDTVGGSVLAEGFPVGSAVDAVASALPAGASLGELPMDIGWREGGLLDVPVVTAAGPVTLTVQVVDGTCSATVAPADSLTPPDLDGIAASVCAEWAATGSLPIIWGPPGEERPDLAAQ